jgi:hypothetical protein
MFQRLRHVSVELRPLCSFLGTINVKVNVMSRPRISRKILLGVKTLLVPKTRFLCLQVCWYGAPTLMRGRVSRLQVLLACGIILRPSPTRFMIIFYCLKFETLQTWRTRSHIYIHEEQGDTFILPLIPTYVLIFLSHLPRTDYSSSTYQISCSFSLA